MMCGQVSSVECSNLAKHLEKVLIPLHAEESGLVPGEYAGAHVGARFPVDARFPVGTGGIKIFGENKLWI